MKTTAAMNILALILGFSLLFAVPLLARENTDVIIMKNGDHLTGQIKGLDSDVLYFGLPYVIQTLSVDWSQVAQLKSKQLFLVKTQDGSVYRGVLNSTETPAGRPLEIQVSDARSHWEEPASDGPSPDPTPGSTFGSSGIPPATASE
jgi:small nuclear ribonucleoprotein (snRNP)-like protein